VPHPWDTGDLERNWQGYLIPGTSILRNRVGAQTPDALRDAENDLVEARVIELREAPDFLGDRTYDLAYLSDPPSALSGRVRLGWRCADRGHREGRGIFLSTRKH
jgi:hypothetical protein